MTWWEAIIIAVVTGLTEFLPISSTGHILLFQRILGIEQTDAADAVAVVLQAGAILAVIGLYWRRAKQMGLGVLGKDPVGLKLLVNIILAFLPFMITALLFYDDIKMLFGLWVSVAGWIIGGIAILIVVWLRRGKGIDEGKSMDALTWQLALVIGLVQCWSLWPGTSRALAAIIGALLVGMSLRAAVEFSFLLGVLTLVAAASYDTMKHGDQIFLEYGFLVPAMAFLMAGVAAAVSVKWMIKYLENYSMAIFGWYRIALGILIGVLVGIGWLDSVG